MAGCRRWTDALGRLVTVPDPVDRLVSLVPSLTEVLFRFGYGDGVVGITDYCTEPASGVSGKLTIGGTKNPDVAAVIDLKPDLVLAVAEENRRQDVEQLAAAGLAVVVFAPHTVRDGIDLLWQVAHLLDCRAQVRSQIEAIERHYDETVRIVADRARVRVFCPIWRSPYMTINHETYVHDMLSVCGGDNIFAHRQRRFPLAADLGQQPEGTEGRDNARDRRYPRVSLDEMAALRPEVILLPDEPYVFLPVHMQAFAPYIDVPAVRNGRLYLIDGKLLSWYGTRIGSSLCTLRALLAPCVRRTAP